MISFRFRTLLQLSKPQLYDQLCVVVEISRTPLDELFSVDKVSSASCLCQVVASPASCPLPRQSAQASEQSFRWRKLKFPTFPPFKIRFYKWLLSLVGYFDLTLVIKLVPKKRVQLYFHMQCLVDVDVDATLACDDDHPIQAPKNTLFSEFVVIGLGIMLTCCFTRLGHLT